MDKAPYCAEAFSPITGGCFQVVSRQDGQAGWSPVTLSSENALSGFRPYTWPYCRPAGRSGPVTGQQAESEAIGSVVRPAWTVAVVARSAAVGLVALMMAECRQRPGRPAHPAVVEAMAEVGIDLCREFPKPLTDQAVRAADVVVTMGCGDACLISRASTMRTGHSRTPAASRSRSSTASATRSTAASLVERC